MTVREERRTHAVKMERMRSRKSYGAIDDWQAHFNDGVTRDWYNAASRQKFSRVLRVTQNLQEYGHGRRDERYAIDREHARCCILPLVSYFHMKREFNVRSQRLD